MIIMGVSGMFLGGIIQRRFLRDYLHLGLFGFDNGKNKNRTPDDDHDGGFLVSILTTALVWFFGLQIYNGILTIFGADESHLCTAGMHNWTFGGYNLALAGLMSFVSDWWNIVNVADQILQEFTKRRGNGYTAYAEHHPRIERVSDWWHIHRVTFSRCWLLVGWTVVPILMITYFYHNKNLVMNEEEDKVLGDGWFWASWNTEFVRMFVASLVAVLNMVVVSQDWDFPSLSGEDVKIVATDFTEVKIHFSWFKEKVPMVAWIFEHCHFYMSGKWVNYFSIFMAIAFDWSYWYMTALVFRPCDYGQFWDSDTHIIYTVKDQSMQEEYAGAASAKDCPFWTDNNLMGTGNPFQIQVGTGIFTGTYSQDEEMNYNFSGDALWLWAMCIPPIVAYIMLFWVISMSHKVHAFNAKTVRDWHSDAISNYALTSENGAATESHWEIHALGKILAEREKKKGWLAPFSCCAYNHCCSKTTEQESPEAKPAVHMPGTQIEIASSNQQGCDLAQV